MLNEVDLLEWAHDNPAVTQLVKQIIGLTSKDDPLNVPLEALDWRQGKIQLYAENSATVESEEDIDVARLQSAAVGIDSKGRRFLAYKNDLLIRNEDSTYSLVKRGVRLA